jgi:hypothetical protein
MTRRSTVWSSEAERVDKRGRPPAPQTQRPASSLLFGVCLLNHVLKFLVGAICVYPTASFAGSVLLMGIGGVAPTSCSASSAFFTRASSNIASAIAAGAPGVAAWQSAVEGLICGQVTGGTFALKDVEYMTVAPTLALAEMNLVSSSFTLAPGASMTFAPNAGLTGVANETGFADVSGYTPSTGQMSTTSGLLGACVLNNRTTLMTSSFLSEVGTQITSNDFVVDVLTGSSASAASIFAVGGTSAAGLTSTQVASTKGGFWASRTASTSVSAYVNGALLDTQDGAGPTSITGIGDFFVLGLNTGTAGTDGLPDTIGAVILGAGETTAQVEADEALFTAALHAMGISSGC